MDGGEKTFWDEAYQTGAYLEHWDYRHPSQELVTAVALERIPRGGAVLDIGCGAGREAIFLAQLGFRVIGVDFSRPALAIARQRAAEAGVEVDWRHGDALALPVEDESIDFANDRGCFHVIQREHRERFAREVQRVLKPGGCLLLRGSAVDSAEEDFVKVDAEEVDRYFAAKRFHRGAVAPIRMVSDAGTLEGNIVFLRKVSP